MRRRAGGLPAEREIPPPDRWDGLVFLLLMVLFGAVYQLGVPLRASVGARITGDEPFYLLTTESLLADGDLDLTNQYDRMSYVKFFDGSGPLWYQSVPTADGTLLSPHNVGLSVLVIPAYAHGGLDGTKAFLGLLGGIGVALAYLLSRRVTAGRLAAAGAAGLVGLSAPWLVYATQIYPETPAALLVALAAWRLLDPRPRLADGVLLAVAAAGLMWLGSKYAPLVGAIGLLTLARLPARARLAFIVSLVPLGAHYLWFHVATYGGATPYAVNQIYAGTDTVELVRAHWAFLDRVYRLLGLWVDREFGLTRWAPVLALALPGGWLLARGRARPALILLGLFGVQLLVATFMAITMRGWWFPGRMLIVVLPLLAPCLAIALSELRPRWACWCAAVMLTAGTIETTSSLWQGVRAGAATLAVNPTAAGGIWLERSAAWWPHFTAYGWDTIALAGLWLIVAMGLIGWAERSLRARPAAAAQLAAVRLPA